MFDYSEKSKKKARYYRYANGKIFKYDLEKNMFYSLDKEGNWVADGYLMSLFYDPSSIYEEINDFDAIDLESEKRRNNK